jgi:uncharacterized protein VirK/YbjX
METNKAMKRLFCWIFGHDFMTNLTDQIDKLLASEPEWNEGIIIPRSQLNVETARQICDGHNRTRRKLVAVCEALKIAQSKFESIKEIYWDWDGDCGADGLAHDGIDEIAARLAEAMKE